MSTQYVWNNIINSLEGRRVELPTVPKTKKIPVWFTASTDGEHIFIDRAEEHRPSSNLSMQRKLNYNTFQKVYPLFLRREKGEAVSSVVQSVTVNSVYYFSLIKHYGS